MTDNAAPAPETLIYRDPAAFAAALPPHGVLFGLDYGAAKIGLAKSDPARVIALPVDTYHRRNVRQDIGHIAALLAETECAGIVAGYPLELSGAAGAMCEETERFYRKLLKKRPLPLLLADERLTTAQAVKAFKNAGLSRKHSERMDDAAAASLILRGFLDSVYNISP